MLQIVKVTNVPDEGDSLEHAAAMLSENVRALRETMQEASDLRDELADLTKSQRLTRRFTVALGIVIIMVIGIGVTQVYTISALKSVVAVQHDSALCPLSKLFINSDTPQSAAAAKARGDDMVQRGQAFATIRISYAALKCEG